MATMKILEKIEAEIRTYTFSWKPDTIIFDTLIHVYNPSKLPEMKRQILGARADSLGVDTGVMTEDCSQEQTAQRNILQVSDLRSKTQRWAEVFWKAISHSRHHY